MGPRVGADGSPPEQYGPWMMAANRHLRNGRVEATNAGMRRTTEVVSGSRFSVLDEGNGEGELPNEDDLVKEVPAVIREDVERPPQRKNVTGKGLVQDHGVQLNKSYFESNPSRCFRTKESTASGSKHVEVVSLVEEHPAEASIRAVPMASGSHVAVTMSDKGNNMRHGLEHEFEVIDDDDPEETNSEVEVAVQNLIPGGQLTAIGMDLGPSQ
ncbi:hypothetical protein V6N11_031292 [Hibiscus sabdariffa]|uniref:Uncharacterized protein n=1 Tax=Hibiscus sabdariffa TaxID=183260 RepID=A0ABR2SX69_9ROSI